MTNLSNPGDHVQKFEQNIQASLDKARMGTPEPVTADSEAEMLATTDPREMVAQVTRRRDAVTQLLADTHDRFDRVTGKREMVLGEDSPRRKALECELHQLNHYTLPLTQQRAADIARRQAALPSAESKLQAEADRAERIHAAAIKRAEEMEVEEAALRLRRGVR
jgi:hypothetical protein